MTGRPDLRDGASGARDEQRLAEEEPRLPQDGGCQTGDAAIKHGGGGVARATTGATDGDDTQGRAWRHVQW